MDFQGVSTWKIVKRQDATRRFPGTLGYKDFDIGIVLTHKRRGVTPIYNQHEYDDEKREAVDQWDVKLRKILKG